MSSNINVPLAGLPTVAYELLNYPDSRSLFNQYTAGWTGPRPIAVVGQSGYYHSWPQTISYADRPLSGSVYAAKDPIYYPNTLGQVLQGPIEYSPKPVMPQETILSQPVEQGNVNKWLIGIGGAMVAAAVILYYLSR